MKEGATHKMQNKAKYPCFQSNIAVYPKNKPNPNPKSNWLAPSNRRFVGAFTKRTQTENRTNENTKRTQMESRHNENAKQSQISPFSIENQGSPKKQTQSCHSRAGGNPDSSLASNTKTNPIQTQNRSAAEIPIYIGTNPKLERSDSPDAHRDAKQSQFFYSLLYVS
jgi:hypothetical protein